MFWTQMRSVAHQANVSGFESQTGNEVQRSLMVEQGERVVTAAKFYLARLRLRHVRALCGWHSRFQ
jgi:hypothetical protein